LKPPIEDKTEERVCRGLLPSWNKVLPMTKRSWIFCPRTLPPSAVGNSSVWVSSIILQSNLRSTLAIHPCVDKRLRFLLSDDLNLLLESGERARRAGGHRSLFLSVHRLAPSIRVDSDLGLPSDEGGPDGKGGFLIVSTPFESTPPETIVD
jgi:hypothetical protein